MIQVSFHLLHFWWPGSALYSGGLDRSFPKKNKEPEEAWYRVYNSEHLLHLENLYDLCLSGYQAILNQHIQVGLGKTKMLTSFHANGSQTSSSSVHCGTQKWVPMTCDIMPQENAWKAAFHQGSWVGPKNPMTSLKTCNIVVIHSLENSVLFPIKFFSQAVATFQPY